VDTKSLQSFIRSGGYAWPGGYPCALLMADGECIDAQAAREHYRVLRSNMRDQATTGRPNNADWLPVDVFVHWEGDDITCAHSGRSIPSAYGNPDDNN
jgi:hypothetical protein